jgi:rhamnosyltransferase
VVVDSGSKDGTLDIVAKYPCRLVRIAAEAYYPGAVLNEALASVESETIVFQNSDVAPLASHALDRLVAPLVDPRVVATFARQVPRPEADGWVRRDYAAAFPADGDAPPFMTYSLPFAAMRRSVWQKRPFYTDAWGSEDTEWGAWARRAGHLVRYVPGSVVMHSHNYTLTQLWGRRFIEGEADAFIHRDRETAVSALTNAVRSVVRDARTHVADRDLRGLLAAPARRAIYHWAHLAGHRLGEERLRTGSSDTSIGQRAVLTRY